MPFNKIHVPKHLPSSLCRAINDELHASLVETCGVNPDDFFCLVTRYEPDDMIFHPSFLGERDVHNTIVFEIALLRGRVDAQKEALFSDMRARLRRLDFDPANSIMFLLENRPIDWSFSEAGSVKKVLGL
ncbi:MAG: tautomerase family protein [Pseudomonadota bacterium]